jgi:hypothetical protein
MDMQIRERMKKKKEEVESISPKQEPISTAAAVVTALDSTQNPIVDNNK